MKNTKQCYLLGIKEETGGTKDLAQATGRVAAGIAGIVESGERNFVCVMNEAGVYAAHCLCEIKKNVPDIHIGALIPCEDVADDWDDDLRDLYFSTVEQCDSEAFFARRFYDGCFEDIVASLTDGKHRVVTVLFR